MEVDGKMIGQSSVIARYVAKEGGIAGKDSIEEAIADSIFETAIELREKHMIPNFFEKDEEKKVSFVLYIMFFIDRICTFCLNHRIIHISVNGSVFYNCFACMSR